jgi:hypothetical protein
MAKQTAPQAAPAQEPAQTPVHQPPAQTPANETPQPAPRPFNPACLMRVGQGFWTYRHIGGDPKDTQQAGFFDEAFSRFGMKEDDVVCVNAAPFGVGLLSASKG